MTDIENKKKAVGGMVKAMLNPKNKRENIAFTMGWDVVATYCTSQINSLLEKRYEEQKSDILHKLVMTLSIKETFQKEPVKAHYDLHIGPPVLEFDHKGTAQPLCFIKMRVIKGTVKKNNGNPRKVQEGWIIRLGQIPLASAKGTVSYGKIQGNPTLVPATTPVTFDPRKEETQHVLLAFELNKDLTVEAFPENPDPNNEEELALTSLAFQKAFREHFTKPTDQGPPSLSYSIASVNNKPDSRAPELRPEKFQFATYSPGDNNSDPSLLSIFLEVEGGPKTGLTKKLQERWTSQWVDNDIAPVPEGFSATLMLSSALFNTVILKKGFPPSSWTVEDDSPKDEAINRIKCNNNGTFKIPEQNYDYGWTSIFHIGKADISLANFPLELSIRQDNEFETPNIYGFWNITHTLDWNATYKLFKWGPRISGGSGKIKGQWHLCHEVDYSKPRKLNTEMTLTDEAFNLEFKLNARDVFRFDQPEGNAIDWGAWHKGMVNLWHQAPDVSISSCGIGFLRTTNLLLPGKHVIDIDENIGIRAPKDIIFFGDVIKG
ncbi:hypothetical protein ACHAPT_008985 [Fusarium lateritium]